MPRGRPGEHVPPFAAGDDGASELSGGFVAAFPRLLHVTDAAAVPRIRREGLRSAAALVAASGAPPELLATNRDRWVTLPCGASLRRQGMRDAALRSRLAPGIALTEWRRFINGMVFFWPGVGTAWRLADAEPAREQVVLAFDTRAVIEAGGMPLACRFNNGYVDRSPPARRRLRGFDDYRPATHWVRGEAVREVALPGGVPAGLPFTVLTR